MRLLLDTHILLWWLADDPAMSSHARALIANPYNEVFFSAINVWEIAIKSRLGKVVVDVDELRREAEGNRLRSLSFTSAHAVEVTRLPDYHRDPFDRALIAQARYEPLHLLTHDETVAAYGGDILLV